MQEQKNNNYSSATRLQKVLEKFVDYGLSTFEQSTRSKLPASCLQHSAEVDQLAARTGARVRQKFLAEVPRLITPQLIQKLNQIDALEEQNPLIPGSTSRM